MPAADLGTRPRLFCGWIVVATAFLVLFTAYGTQYAFVYSVFALGAGRLTDRWGHRAVTSTGGALLGIGLILMSRVTTLWQPYLLYGTVAALGMSTSRATPPSGSGSRAGAALRSGLASAGGSLGTFALPPIAHLLVTHLGWRGAYVVFGAAVLVALNVLAVLMRRDPEAMGLRPDGAPAIGASNRSRLRTGGMDDRPNAAPPRVLDALRHLRGHVDAGVHPARPPGAHGPWTRHRSAPGRHAGQRRRRRRDGGPPGHGRGVGPNRAPRRARGRLRPAGRGLPGLRVVARPRRALHASVVFGFSSGAASTLFTATVADFFGREHAASLAGLLFSLAGSMAACGPFAAGIIYDRAGDYRLAWWLSAACNRLALSLLVFTRPPAPRDEAATA